MGRPQLDVGTYGEVRVGPNGKGGFEASCQFRDLDGKRRRVRRTGTTKGQARARLSQACKERQWLDPSAAVTPNTPLSTVCELWYAWITTQGKSPTTLGQYRGHLDRWVIPGIGSLRVRECTTSRCESFLGKIQEHSASSAKSVKSILSGVLSFAARHDAITFNPTREVSRIVVESKPARSLTWEAVRDVRAKLMADEKAVRRDLPDFVDMMLATGTRIGEASGITPERIDLAARTVTISSTVVRIKGKGLVNKPLPKGGKSGIRILQLPEWTAEMLRRRIARLSPGEPVFPAPAGGGWRDPSNSSADVKEALGAAGYGWATSHIFRKTVATVMSDAGIPTANISGQLGHKKTSMTQDRYIAQQTVNSGAAELLERLGTAS